MIETGAISADRKDRILREVLRNYLEFEAYCSQSGSYIIEHKGVMLSFSDLKKLLADLSPRKKQAIWYNVILSFKQWETAEKMGIKTGTVGQYVDSALEQLVDRYFAEEDMQ